MSEVIVCAKKIGDVDHLSWNGELLKETNEWIVVHGELGSDAYHHSRDLRFKFTHEIIGVISRTEYYNIFAGYDGAGEFDHAYCNIATPGRYDKQSSEVSWIDLELDVVFDKNGGVTLLDEDEFDEAIKQSKYDTALINKVTSTAKYLMRQSNAAEFPFIRSHRDEMLSHIKELS